MDHDPHPHEAHETPEPDVFDLPLPDDVDVADPVVSVPVIDLEPGETAVGGARGPGVDDTDLDPETPGGTPRPEPGDEPGDDPGSRPGPVDLGTGDDRPGDHPIVLDDRPAAPGPGASAPAHPEPGPISLDLDDPPSTAGAEDAGRAHDDSSIRLDGDLDVELDERRPSPQADGDRDAGPEETADTVELPLETSPPTVDFALADDNGFLRPALIAAALAAIGAGAADLRGRRWTSLASPPDVAAALDQLGLDARVEHADLRELRDRMAEGHRVLLSTDGSAGVDLDAVVEVVRIDEPAGTVEVIDRSGARRAYRLDELLAAWDESANQLVVAAGSEGTVVLLPVVLGPSVAAPSRQARA